MLLGNLVEWLDLFDERFDSFNEEEIAMSTNRYGNSSEVRNPSVRFLIAAIFETFDQVCNV